MTAANSVQYMSEKIRLRNKYSIRERFKQFFTGARRLECIVENSSESFGYAGLTYNSGRIVVIDQAARSKDYVREKEQPLEDGGGEIDEAEDSE